MTIAELQGLPLWPQLPAAIRKTLELAQTEGWELHGKGATIAFRLDRPQDELALPCFAIWEVGVTPKGAQSFRGGKAGTPLTPLTITDLAEYLADPTVVYLEEDVDEEAG